MYQTIWLKLSGLLVALGLLFVLSGDVSAQGKGKGGGRGNSNKSKKSDGSIWGGGILDGKNKNKQSKRDDFGKSQRFKGLSKKTGVTEDVLRSRYEYERGLNPRLTYGQFVAAHMISRNHRGISTGDILGGLRDGKSIGQTLKNKGWDRDRIDRERRRLRDMNKDDDDYDDRDDYWRFGF